MTEGSSSAEAIPIPERRGGSGASLEAALIDATLEGDGKAFATLVQPHLQTLYRVAYRACGNASLAEDAVQETLTIAYRSLKRYQPGTSFRSYLAAIAVKRAHTLLRSETRRAWHESGARVSDRSPGADAALEAEETANRIRETLARLPEKRRAAALLRLDAGLSYAEIARALGISEGSARVHVHNALKALRSQLGDVLAEGGSDRGARGGTVVQGIGN